ncbi:MAG: TerC family protein [Rhodobacteraceae bacterium]|nr:TerC family protein [Paracoccaceae bacterium]
MFETEVIAAFLSLCLLEIVLGIDNVLFIAIVAARLPKERRRTARIIGLSIGLLLRIALLFSITWLLTLNQPVMTVLELDLSWRDLIMIGGGGFLVIKAVHEIIRQVEEESGVPEARDTSFVSVILQIAIIDVVFSIDSVLTAVGIAEEIWVMIAAILVAIVVMIVAAESVAGFLERYPWMKMIGLALLVLVGVVLIADGFHHHVDRRYVYLAVVLAIVVSVVRLTLTKRRNRA